MKLNQNIAHRIVEHVSQGVHRSISVVDTSFSVLASTNQAFVGKRIPPDDNEDIADAPQSGMGSMRLPVTFADETIGHIIIHELAQHGEEVAYVVKVLADLIVHQTAVLERLPRPQELLDKFVYDLLHGRLHGTPREMRQEASLLSIDLTIPRVVVLVYIEPIAHEMQKDAGDYRHVPSNNSVQQRSQLRDYLLQHMRSVMPPNANNVYSFVDEHRFVGLIVTDPNTSDVQRQRLAQHVQQFLDVIHDSTGVHLSAGVGNYHPGWRALSQSHRDAEVALDIGRTLRGPGHAFALFDLDLAAYVWTERRQAKAALAQRLLNPILGDAELLKTLEVFLEQNLSSSVTARHLHIHRHTLAYRLDKIAHLTGCDPRLFTDAACLSAALLVHKLSNADDA